MAPKEDATSSKATQSMVSELTSIAQLLHLAHHRNKNQHRLSKWYKSFSQLRREVIKLLLEVENLETAISFASTSESKYITAAREKVEVRTRFWESRLMKRWYLSFSNLTADNQYAALGLMLVGCLARLRTVISPFNTITEKANMAAVELTANLEYVEDQDSKRDDLGEVISRQDLADAEMNIEDVTTMLAVEVGGRASGKTLKQIGMKKAKARLNEPSSRAKIADSTPVKRVKKKRKKGDAFDDLFSGLI